MKQPLLYLCLVLGVIFSGAPAHAAPPSEAQIDTLLETMDMQRTLDELFVQMDTMSERMGQQMLGENATPEERESLRRISARQKTAMRKAMSWETLAPIYRRIYARLFTAEEVDAMNAFYGSETGRGILRKMPQAMQLSMEEMQPMLQTMIAELQKTLESELQRSGDDAQKGDRAR
jgi:uncharacterized protein